jgi:hypothetical protein
VTYSCIEQLGFAGTNGNIGSNPQFLDAANWDFHLSSGSPCIDAGNGNVAPKLDIDGNLRYDDPAVTNTGTGDPAYSDIGVYECTLISSAEYAQSDLLRIYPNPSTGIFTIAGADIQQIEVYSLNGILIYSSRDNSTREINLGQQPKGLYLIKIKTNRGLVVKRVVIY